MVYDKLDPRFQDLKLPQNCIIVYDTFFDIEPPFEDPQSDDWKYFKEFLLQILFYKKSQPRVVLNLGWFPEGNSEGKFIIKVFRIAFPHEKILEFESRSKDEIVRAIYEILKEVAENKFVKPHGE